MPDLELELGEEARGADFRLPAHACAVGQRTDRGQSWTLRKVQGDQGPLLPRLSPWFLRSSKGELRVAVNSSPDLDILLP